MCEPHPINLKALRAKPRFPEEEETLFVNNVSAPIQEFLAHLPVLYISDLHNQMPQMHKSQLLEMSVCMCQFSSVSFSRSVMSDSLRLHGLQHARPPCPSPTPGAYQNSCPIELVMPSNHLILCHPLLLSHSIFPSIGVFLNEKCVCAYTLLWLELCHPPPQDILCAQSLSGV